MGQQTVSCDVTQRCQKARHHAQKDMLTTPQATLRDPPHRQQTADKLLQHVWQEVLEKIHAHACFKQIKPTVLLLQVALAVTVHPQLVSQQHTKRIDVEAV